MSLLDVVHCDKLPETDKTPFPSMLKLLPLILTPPNTEELAIGVLILSPLISPISLPDISILPSLFTVRVVLIIPALFLKLIASFDSETELVFV